MPPPKSASPYSTAAASPRTTVTPHGIRGRAATNPGSGPGQGELRDVEVTGAETGLGVGEVERPHPAERLVEAQRGNLGGTLLERGAPAVQRLGVVPPEAVPVGDAQRGAREGAL